MDRWRWRDRQTWATGLALLGLVALALALRLPGIERRPMHNDEANQAYKAGLLMDTGRYRYDPFEHHGPTLYYLTLPEAWLQARGHFADTEILTYRIVPLIFGVLLIVLLVAVRDALGTVATVAAGVWIAVSPAMVYFSRFYIQEMLLVCFSFGLLAALWRYHRAPGYGWAVVAGLCAGLMHATKETCILAWGAMAVAAAVEGYRQRRRPERTAAPWERERLYHLGAAAAAAMIVSVTFFTSFFTHWRGPLDSVLTYTTYLNRGVAPDTTHNHPFWFYLRILTYAKPARGPAWGEDIILVLGAVGALAAWIRPRSLQGSPVALRCLSLYAVVLTLVYSAIPYKTPWCLLSFWHPWLILAGAGTQVVVLGSRRVWLRALLALLLAAGAANLARRALLASGRYAAN
ncbi:MAG: TIGR03663 family protein, partial [Lentisphaeria bacterium]|nr:TIGR03663 family protein [Lentisphaeria bacterium]